MISVNHLLAGITNTKTIVVQDPILEVYPDHCTRKNPHSKMQINMRELQFLVSEPVNLNLQILNQFTISLKIAVGKNQPLYW